MRPPEGGIAIFTVGVSGGSSWDYPITVTWQISTSDPYEMKTLYQYEGSLSFGLDSPPQQLTFQLLPRHESGSQFGNGRISDGRMEKVTDDMFGQMKQPSHEALHP